MDAIERGLVATEHLREYPVLVDPQVVDSVKLFDERAFGASQVSSSAIHGMNHFLAAARQAKEHGAQLPTEIKVRPYVGLTEGEARRLGNLINRRQVSRKEPLSPDLSYPSSPFFSLMSYLALVHLVIHVF